LITDKKNVPLAVVTADCLPVLLFDPVKKVVGVLHAGRKGLLEGVISNTVQMFEKEFGSEPKDILVGIGPGIEKKCYEVEGEMVDIRHQAHFFLRAEGILKEHIEDLDFCTKCNMDRFYSYRGGDDTQRFASVISLV
jgi:copper oxidase (laccase) domain-containing protein